MQDALPLDIPEPIRPAALPPSVFDEPLPDPPRYTVLPSPVGELLVTGDGRSVTGVHMLPDGAARDPVRDDRQGWRHDPGAFADVAAQLAAYFAGELSRFSLPLAPAGSAFQRAVWRELTTIPYGATTSYGAIATAVGQPGAARAVGIANNRNPISVIVPCHRVIGADGSLVGYGGGLERKRFLLALERGRR